MTRVPHLRRAVKHNARLALWPTFALLLVVGCRQAEPTGQVLASVNGEEITIPELNAEARARGLTIGDNPELQKRLLSELVDRKLLAQEARKQKLDRTPEFLLAERRANEILLAQELVSTSSASARDDNPQELAAVVKSNPRSFDQRVLIRVDQITISSPLTAGMSKALESATSLDAVASLVSAWRIPLVRRLELWDSASVAPSTTEKLLAVKEGGVAILADPQNTVAVRVISVTPDPTAVAERTQVARELLQSQRQQLLAESYLERAKTSAKIRYQRGLRPPQ